MSAIPQNAVAEPLVELASWFTLKKQIADLQASEKLLRGRLFGHFFPSPKEGTNTFVLPDGHQLKGTYPIDRKVDPAMLDALRTVQVCQLTEEQRAAWAVPADALPGTLVYVALRMNVDALLKYEPELVTKAYRELTAEQRNFFDCCLVIKPGSFNMKVDPPSAKAAKAEAPKAAGFGPQEAAQ